MTNFIKVHDILGCETLVNLDLVYQVIEITDAKRSRAEIHWAYQDRCSVEGEYLVTAETYGEIKEMIMGSRGADNG